MMGGCFKPEDSPNPIDTAFVCAITQSISQHCVVAKNTKNMQVEFKYNIAYGVLGLSLIVPPTAAALKTAMGIYKKSFGPKVAKHAYKLLTNVSREFKKSKESIIESVSAMCNAWTAADAFLKQGTSLTQAKIKTLQDQLEAKLPRKCPDAKMSVQRKTKFEVHPEYLPLIGFSYFPEIIRTAIVAAM